MATSLDLTKQALAEIGTRTKITSLSDGSPEANYATLLYNPLRDFLLREGDYDWSLGTQVPVVAADVPAFPWIYSYNMPTASIRIRALLPSVYNALDPVPLEWNSVATGATRLIWTKTAASLILYTFAPPEDNWDSIFRESFVRLLGSALAFALENRIEASQVKLNEAISFAGIANLRDS